MAFTRDDFNKLQSICGLLRDTLHILQQHYPNEDELDLLAERLGVFASSSLRAFVEYVNEDNNIVYNFDPITASLGNDCFDEMDLISDDIYNFIDRKRCGRVLLILQNEDLF
jgi:hypothetical protein